MLLRAVQCWSTVQRKAMCQDSSHLVLQDGGRSGRCHIRAAAGQGALGRRGLRAHRDPGDQMREGRPSGVRRRRRLPSCTAGR